ncbi:MAG: cyclodeaminase [Candidatus Promineifilaceae bacterium]|nr:cyclodeaminase [Candidatus Promineifilaceae bacterium]
MKITILTEEEIRQVVGVDDEALAAVTDAFNRLAQGKAVMPPIMRIDVPENNGEVDVKSAYLQGLDSFAVKMSSGFFDNPKMGLPSLSGMMILLSTETGFPQAVLLDNGYLTDVRTGMAGALAARHLAPEQIATVGVIGSGSQARYQIRSLQLVRDFERVLVYSINREDDERYAKEMAPLLGADVVPADDAETVVRESDVVVTTTPAKTPIVKAAWLHPGLHITAMGSDAEAKQELEAAVLGRADVVACDTKAQAFRLGELHHGLDEGVITEDDAITELGELTLADRSGRRALEQITVCDLTGTGAQDTAIARLAYLKARAAGLGLEVEA